MYFDGNNLYGWAMCQPLPYTDFHWIDVDNFDVISITTDSPTGYILEMDLEYPQHLHDAHSAGLSNARGTIRQARGEAPHDII